MTFTTEPDDATLAETLSGLASSVRLRLLRQVRTPRALSEIDLKADDAPPQPDAPPARPLSRQAIKFQLDQLLEAGIVRAREAERDYGPTVEYIVNHQRIYAIAEAVRELAKLKPAAELTEPTLEAKRPEALFQVQGPCLVLAKGLHEGQVFPLATKGPAGEWVIGRRRGLAVSLDFDPFASTENSAVVLEGGTFFVKDIPGSLNGTLLNFRPIPPGGRQELTSGDLIGVGRSVLVFRR